MIWQKNWSSNNKILKKIKKFKYNYDTVYSQFYKEIYTSYEVSVIQNFLLSGLSSPFCNPWSLNPWIRDSVSLTSSSIPRDGNKHGMYIENKGGCKAE